MPLTIYDTGKLEDFGWASIAAPNCPEGSFSAAIEQKKQSDFEFCLLYSWERAASMIPHTALLSQELGFKSPSPM